MGTLPGEFQIKRKMSTRPKRNVPAKKPSYDDDFDSDESEEDKPLKPPPKKQPAKKPSKPAKPSSKVKDESEDEDSDFEDPDTIAIPSEIKPLKSGDSAQSMPSFGAGNGASNVRTIELGSSKSKLNSSGGSDDLEILEEIPGKKRPNPNNLGNINNLSSLLGSGNNVTGGANPFFNSQTGSSAAANSMDILQKSMQNGGLSSILNNYNFLSGGGITNPNAVAALAGASGSSLLKSNNLYPSLNKSQISSLWGNGPSAGLMGSIPRGPYGNFSGNQYMPGMPGMMGPGGQMMPKPEEEPGDEEDEEDMGVIETYSNYWPTKLKIGKPHPDPVVETASLASVEPPEVWHDLSLPEETVMEGKLSALQLEAVTYACQQHEQFLASGERAGFLIGDGAGVGKGRTIAGIMLENFLQGRKKSIWVCYFCYCRKYFFQQEKISREIQ